MGAAATGKAVEVEVSGDPVAVNSAFSESKFEIKSSDSKQNFVVRVSVKDQDAIDVLVDRIRSQNVSLISLTVDHVSLEAAFLQIVDDPNAEDSQKVAAAIAGK